MAQHGNKKEKTEHVQFSTIEVYSRVVDDLIKKSVKISKTLSETNTGKKNAGMSNTQRARGIAREISSFHRKLDQIDLVDLFSKSAIFNHTQEAPLVRQNNEDIISKTNAISVASTELVELQETKKTLTDSAKLEELSKIEEEISFVESYLVKLQKDLRELQLKKHVLTLGVSDTEYKSKMQNLSLTFLRILAGSNSTITAEQFCNSIREIRGRHTAVAKKISSPTPVAKRSEQEHIHHSNESVEAFHDRKIQDSSEADDRGTWRRAAPSNDTFRDSREHRENRDSARPGGTFGQPISDRWEKAPMSNKSHTSKFRDDVPDEPRQTSGKYIAPHLRNQHDTKDSWKDVGNRSRDTTGGYGRDRDDRYGGKGRSFGSDRREDTRYSQNRFGELADDSWSNSVRSKKEPVRKTEVVEEYPALSDSSLMIKPEASKISMGKWGQPLSDAVKSAAKLTEEIQIDKQNNDEEDWEKSDYLIIRSDKHANVPSVVTKHIEHFYNHQKQAAHASDDYDEDEYEYEGEYVGDYEPDDF